MASMLGSTDPEHFHLCRRLSRVLMPGDVYYVPAKGKYKATFGNAGGIDVWVGGKLAPQLGQEYKKVSGIELTPENLIKAAK